MGVGRSCDLELLWRGRRGSLRGASVLGGQEVELVGGEVGLEGLVGAVDGEMDGEAVRAADVEGAEGGWVVPGDPDAQQFLQVDPVGQGRGFVHGGRVVDRGEVEGVGPVPLLVAVAEALVADALDVGFGLQLDGAFPERDGRGALRGGCFPVVLQFEYQREWVAQDADSGEEHVQVEHGDGKIGCAQGLEHLHEGERSIFVAGLEARTVAGYFVSFFDEVRVEGVDVSGGGEVERLFGFQVSWGEGCFEFVSDEALAAVVFIGEGGREILLGIDVEAAMALLERIGSTGHTAGRECEAEWPTVSIGFHCIRPFEYNLSVLQ